MIRAILKQAILLLVKLGLVKAPKAKLYMVIIQVLLDGNVIHKFPADIPAFSRAAAKLDARRHLSFKTCSTAKNLGLNAAGEKTFEVTLQVLIKGIKVKTYEVLVNVAGRREAKFDITRRITFRVTAAALKDDLLKHRLNRIKTANK